jgi:hypothetical protein
MGWVDAVAHAALVAQRVSGKNRSDEVSVDEPARLVRALTVAEPPIATLDVATP